MKIITFGTLKGGVGKTMLCFNIGGILAQINYKILLIDSDLQGNLTNNIGIDRTNSKFKTLFDIYNLEESPPSPEEIVISIPNSNIPNLDIIAGSIFLHRAELKIANLSGREQILKNYINDNKKFFSKYDYILIDTNPSMSIVNQNALLSSDCILMVSDVSMNSLEGSQLFLALWEETCRRLRISNNIKGLIINDFDTRNKLSSDFIEYLKTSEEVADIKNLMFQTIIPRNIRITESELAAIPINLYDNNSKGCIAISTLVKELFNKKIL